MSKSLFEEAIADARQLREAAEQNAKNAIIEAVTPRIREFIESQLVGSSVANENEDFISSALSEAKDEVDDEEVELDESAIRSLVNLMGGKKQGQASEIASLAEAFETLTEDEQSRLMKLLREEDQPEKPEEESASETYEINLDEIRSSMVSKIKNSKKSNGDKNMKYEEGMEEDLYELDEMMDDEMDLEEADLVFSPEDLEGLDDSVKDKLKAMMFNVKFSDEEGAEGEEVEVSDEEEAPEEEEAAPAEEEGESMSETVYEIDENMLRSELARLREAKSRKKKSGSSAAAHKIAAASFGGGTLEGEAHDVVINKGDKKTTMKEARENRALKQQLNDYRGAVETLREQLSDLNLFNAKLLYVNKILQNKDVAPNQRRAIIEALDGANNLREAKLLYESLSTSMTSKNESLNESVKHTAGLASRPVTSSSARMSGAGEVDRWAVLAGLK